MKKIKICVYAIAKNEEKFVDRFMDSIKEVKDVYILDTGSTDNTIELFKKRGAIVKQKKYRKFKFDKARNDSLALVPKDVDVCICLDIDDCIEPGFTKEIRKIWQKDTGEINYEYIYSLDEYDKPLISFYNNHIHSRKGYKWIYPIHEVLEHKGKKKILYNHNIRIIHRPDKNKSRQFYLELLKERVDNYPDDNRNIYLLAREYLSKHNYEESIKVCKQYLNNIKFTKIPERSKIMYYLAKNYRLLKDNDKAIVWSKLSMQELPNNKDPYIELLINYYEKEEYDKAIDIGLKALNITDKNPGIINDISCEDGTLYDYLSLCYYKIKDYENALKYIDIDIKEHPKNERLIKNREIMLKEKDKIK